MTIQITPALPYFAATADCDWQAARSIAADMGDEHVAAVDRAELVAAVEAAIEGGADDWRAPSDWQPGDRDGCWDHPAAAEARRITAERGMSWDFVTWGTFLRTL